ncbi:hypothetical protein ACWGQ5_39845 [Streptomyces sp. NPDC055722]
MALRHPRHRNGQAHSAPHHCRPPPSDEAWRLLRRFAFNIPGAYGGGEPDPGQVISAARQEAAVRQGTDESQRRSATARARAQLNDVQELFSVSSLHILRDTGAS